MSSKPDKQNFEENEKIKTQIDASIGIARSLIDSWLPPLKDGEKEEDDVDDDTLNNYSTGRPDRLGLGAKFLSHAEAMRHNKDGAPSSKEELILKNKILNQNRKAQATTNQPIGKRYRPQDDEDSDSDEESRSTTVGVQQKKAKNKATTITKAPVAATNKKKIGKQGDFLSMYLNERAGKKKNKNKK